MPPDKEREEARRNEWQIHQSWPFTSTLLHDEWKKVDSAADRPSCSKKHFLVIDISTDVNVTLEALPIQISNTLVNLYTSTLLFLLYSYI